MQQDLYWNLGLLLGTSLYLWTWLENILVATLLWLHLRAYNSSNNNAMCSVWSSIPSQPCPICWWLTLRVACHMLSVSILMWPNVSCIDNRNMHIHAHTNTYTHVCMFACICTQTCVHKHTHIHIYTYIHTHIHMHTWTRAYRYIATPCNFTDKFLLYA